jgi:hypothetical protein
MNERIKELIEQATTEEHDGFLYFDKKKFAELIVRKCLNIVESTEFIGDGWRVTLEETAQEIKKHFGVEE